MMKINDLRKSDARVVVLGLHPGIIQSMLDYDYMLGKPQPSIVGIVMRGRKRERFHWGKGEIELPLYATLDDIPRTKASSVTAVINVQSARNVRASVIAAIDAFTHVKVIVVFAENTPEIHALDIAKAAAARDIVIVGPSSVGLLIPGTVKLGAIGGTMYEQLADAGIKTPGDVAVITTSGGMVNELIRVVTGRGRGISFAVAMGGDRYPVLDPVAALLLAEKDPLTKEIIYFGELGGTDEYRIVELIEKKKLTKRLVVYIAGVVAELFTTPPQFGHAKALAQSADETATAKKAALRAAGAEVCDRFDDIKLALAEGAGEENEAVDDAVRLRRKSYFMSHLSGESDGHVQLLGRDLLETVQSHSVASLVLSVTLGHDVHSKRLTEFTDFVLRLLVDHSPNVSGAVNTIIAARAGKDMVSSLAAGLLTIGPRFGGAVNEAARTWLLGVESGVEPRTYVENVTRSHGVISGIGHKKYRADNPDPRVDAIVAFARKGRSPHLDFARSIEVVTTAKKSNLILNVDGAIAAVMIDLLISELGYTHEQLVELTDIEFFNSLFIVSRAIGFTGHYLDQRRNDEGLFRLDDRDLHYFAPVGQESTIKS